MSQPIFRFVKMHGLGNDFVVINGIQQQIAFSPAEIAHLANRHLGIGFDQLLVVETARDADFACKIFNADGSEAEQCGNGMRCVARFIQEEQFTEKNNFTIATRAGIVNAVIHDYDAIEVTLGVPCFIPHEIPFVTDQEQAQYELKIGDAIYSLSVLSMGNPHAIIVTSALNSFPLNQVGTALAKHPAFPQGVNVGVLEIINPQQIRLRTFERGVGETFACGSNACAAVVAGILNHQLAAKVTVELAYGKLTICWEGRHHPVVMTGSAQRVFAGKTC